VLRWLLGAEQEQARLIPNGSAHRAVFQKFKLSEHGRKLGTGLDNRLRTKPIFLGMGGDFRNTMQRGTWMATTLTSG
jgi:hypothetical protein